MMSSDDNNNTTKSIHQLVDQFSDQEMDNNPSVASDSCILTDDALIHVFKYLALKDLLAIESVSHQFRECVSTRLKSQKSLTIGQKTGENDVDIECLYLIQKNTKPLDDILKKCPNIKSLHLQNTCIDYPTLEVIVNGWPQLTHLSLLVTSLDEKSVTDGYRADRCMQLLSQSLPQLVSLTVNASVVLYYITDNGISYTPLSLDIQSLSPFTELNVLRLDGHQDMYELEKFCKHLVANRQSIHEFTLELSSQSYCDQLMARLRAINVSIPDYFRIQLFTK